VNVPAAGRIKWVRSLHSHLEDLVMEVSSHLVLKTLPATSELLRRYSVVSAALVNYEADMKETWMKQNVSFHS
jgi:dynein heavy chain